MDLSLKRFSGRISDNDLRLLRTFATVVRHGGFVPAESELQVGLPSISRYIKDLEVRLGVRLCDRGRRGFALTSEGVHVYEACVKLFEQLESFESTIRDMYANPVGALRIGIIDAMVSAPQQPLAAAIDSFKRIYPNIYLNVSFMTSNRVEQDIIDGRLDLGIVFERRHMEQLQYHFLYEEWSNLYCSSTHPLWDAHGPDVTEADLTALEYVGYPFITGMGKLKIEGFVHRTATVNHIEAIAILLRSSRYLGYLPDHYVEALPDKSTFRKVSPKVFGINSRISAITRQGPLSGLIPQFLKHLMDSAARSAK
ncbi:LysR family transcriptional regulator [Asticcacaulis sp. SL142]|uniref:LysR family transcriptional regulator n=1 Tax=Asticcacaulis sp. SL142 TaxID=2995155 RepID=UPI00226CC108|nr:LysR family transcriptional regulator [Asticcacaulis sp. SL142]WAC48269.1 LysR family transcriptional regulator [Asticcacaulis sp. SL142]